MELMLFIPGYHEYIYIIYNNIFYYSYHGLIIINNYMIARSLNKSNFKIIFTKIILIVLKIISYMIIANKLMIAIALK
jgi:hypothetical protein